MINDPLAPGLRPSRRLDSQHDLLPPRAYAGSSAAPPYLPSIGMCRAWLAGRLAGLGDGEAWRRAEAECGRKPRDLARCLVEGAHGQQPLTLSVAIEGGASVVKRGKPWLWRLSDHGDWPRLHLRALETAYASTPYYIHYISGIETVLGSVRGGESFRVLTIALGEVIKDALQVETLLPRLRREDLSRFEKIEVENTELTVLDVIFKKGPDALFALF